MPRSQRADVAFVDAGGFLNSGSVEVRDVDAAGVQGALSTIYLSETGSTKANPFLTTTYGFWEFWAEAYQRYNIIISGTGYTTRSLRWDNEWFAPRSRSVSVTELAIDVLPIGTKVDWWRPSAAVPIPSGWVEMMGQTLTAAQHDFPGGGSIVLPNMRNKFTLGASTARTHGVASIAGSDPPNAPGIGGKGGTNALKSISHTHPIGHSHGFYHVVQSGDGSGGAEDKVAFNAGGSVSVVRTTHTHVVSISGTTGGASSSSSGIGGGYQDMRPGHVGLLPIIKVKNA